jgi:hypothetical protein
MRVKFNPPADMQKYPDLIKHNKRHQQYQTALDITASGQRLGTGTLIQ